MIHIMIIKEEDYSDYTKMREDQEISRDVALITFYTRRPTELSLFLALLKFVVSSWEVAGRKECQQFYLQD